MKEVTRIVLVLFLLSLGTQNAGTEENFDTSEQVLDHFFELFSDSAFGYEQTESAGWIIQWNEQYILSKWPKMDEKYKQVWNQLIPEGVVAIAHTHPTSDIQKPSDKDVALAKAIKLPVYTICKAGIFKASPDGAITRIQPRDWFKPLKEKQKLAESNRSEKEVR
ncbi:MAG TPA: hypothetical protein VLH08_02125 [Acidobacteriota bacterium]|nr:hypothetical protein [Acidobacteriota bacterium]